MFWRFGGYASISTLDSILDKPDVTLEEVLEESDLIQELKQHNSKLIEYLREEKILCRLLEYVIAPKAASTEPTPSSEEKSASDNDNEAKDEQHVAATATLSSEEREKEEKQRLKYAYVACEVLSSDTWVIVDSLMSHTDHLRKFWKFLERPAPLDPLQASYFTKVNETLLDKKTEEMMNFIKTMDGMVVDMLKHVDCPMIMDLMLKMISMEKCEGGSGIVDWLHDQNLIPRLLAFLSDQFPPSTQTASGDFIKALITISANASQNESSCIGPNDLTRQLVSEKCISKLIKDMLKGGNPLTVGVGIIIEVIRKNNSDYDPEIGNGPDSIPTSKDPIYLGTLLRLFADHVPQFMQLIQSYNTTTNPDGTTNEKRKELRVAFGGSIEPLGFDRFKTCELMAELLHCSNMALLNEKGGDQYVKERDRERERLKQERRRQQQKLDDDGQTTDNEGVVVDKPQLHVQNGEVDLSDDGMNEDEYEDVTISAILDEPTLMMSTTEKKKDVIKSSESSTVFEKNPQAPVASFGNHPIPVSIPADEIPPLNIKPKGPIQKETVQQLDEIVKERAALANEDVVMEDVPPPPPPKDDPPVRSPSTTAIEPPKSPSPFPASTSEMDEKTQKDEQSQSDDLKLSVPEHAVISPISPERLDAELPPLPAEPQDEEENLMDLSEGEVQDGNVSIRSLASVETSFTDYIQLDIDGKPVVGDHLKMMFVENKVVPTILEFFFRFPWNNFLHNVVYDVVQQVFNGPMDRGYNRALAIDLFVAGKIIDRIIGGQKMSEQYEQERKMRLGFMGHLTLVAEEVVKFQERSPPEIILEKMSSPTWIEYVEETLATTRERDNAILGGVRPEMHMGPRIAGIGGPQMQVFNQNAGASGLDSIDLANVASGAGGSGTNTGGLLSSGFGSSSDEEDEDMEHDDEDDEVARLGLSGSSDQFASYISQEITNVDRLASSDEDDDDDDDDSDDDDDRGSFTSSPFSSRFDGAAPSDPPPPPPPLPLNIRRAQKREEREKERRREEEERNASDDYEEDDNSFPPLRRKESHESDPQPPHITQSAHRDPLDDDFDDEREIERLLAGRLEGMVISASDFYGHSGQGKNTGSGSEPGAGDVSQPEVTVHEMEIMPEKEDVKKAEKVEEKEKTGDEVAKEEIQKESSS